MRTFVLLALIVAAVPSVAPGQGTKAPASKTPATKTDSKAPATKTAPAQDAKGAQAAATKTAPAQAAGAVTKQAAGPQTKAGGTPAGRRPALAVAPETPAPPKIPVIMREVFDYDIAGRRDPFVSLLTTSELRPTVADLRLVIVLFDETGRRPVAVMRDVSTNTQYRVTTGMTLGRMRVAEIKRRSVIFSIEEFGLNRQDSLVLGDTTKARAR